MSAVKFIVGVLTVQLLFQGSSQINFRQRYFKFDHAGACPGSPTKIAKLEKSILSQPDKFHYYMDTELSFFRDIIAPVKFHIRTTRCPLKDDSKCIHFDLLQFSICEHLNDENAMWTPFIKSINPKFRCPIKMGTYKIKNGTVDFSALSRLPLEGYRYSSNLIFYEMTKPKPVDILCINFNLTIASISNHPSRRIGKPAL